MTNGIFHFDGLRHEVLCNRNGTSVLAVWFDVDLPRGISARLRCGRSEIDPPSVSRFFLTHKNISHVCYIIVNENVLILCVDEWWNENK